MHVLPYREHRLDGITHRPDGIPRRPGGLTGYRNKSLKTSQNLLEEHS